MRIYNRTNTNRILSLVLAFVMVISMLPMFAMTAFAADGDAQIEIIMNDSYGDGWNGAAIKIDTDKEYLGWAELGDGSSETWSADYDPSSTYTFYWRKGGLDDECSFEIRVGGETVFSATTDDCFNYTDETIVYILRYVPPKQVSATHHSELDATHSGYYAIENVDHLEWFADQVNGGNTDINAVLTKDIVVNEDVLSEMAKETPDTLNFHTWTPIGNESNEYHGIFDGNGKTVSGLYFNEIIADYVGLFGHIGYRGTVENVGVVDSYISGGSYVGGVAGYNWEGTVENCYNTGAVSGDWYVGGVTGANYGTVANSYNSGSVSGNFFVGGVVGVNFGHIEDCYNTGTVISDVDVGGVVGWNSGTVTNCYFNSEKYSGNAIGLNDASSNKVEGKTTAQFESGEVAYLLQGEQADKVWGQNLSDENKDEYPVLGGAKVYAVTNCKNEIVSYSNTEGETVDHKYGTLIAATEAVHTATELKPAVAAHYQCSLCQKYFTEDKEETTLKALTGEMPSHSYGTWVMSDPSQHWKVCECGAETEKKIHVYGDDHTCECGAVQIVTSVTITWGVMSFTYTDESGWDNPDSAWVQVENTGNTGVSVTYEYATERTDVTGSFFDGTNAITTPVYIAPEDSKKVWLRLDGRPNSVLNNTTIGSVKLTIE